MIAHQSPAGKLPRLHDIVTMLDGMAAFASAESWDNVGLLIGNPDSGITGIMVCLDATEDVLDEAVATGCNLLITHHPVIFKPLTAIRTDQPTGRLIARLLAAGVSVVSCHTNLDVARQGVNSELARVIGLTESSPLVPGGNTKDTQQGFGRIGSLPHPIGGEDFIRHVLNATRTPAIRIAGRLPKTIHRVAVCGGSGSDLCETAQQLGADIFITGEIKHSSARQAEASGFCVADAGHYATERLVTPWLARQLASALKDTETTIAVRETRILREPFAWHTTQGIITI